MQGREQQTCNPYDEKIIGSASHETRAGGTYKTNRALGLRLNIWHWHDLLHSTHNSEEERAIADGNPLQTIIVRLAGEGPGSKFGANCRVIRLVTRHESSPRTYL